MAARDTVVRVPSAPPSFARTLAVIFCWLLKIAPLAIYARAACCKFEIPVLGCDTPACLPGASGPCQVTGNTAELKHFCEHGWVPWLNGLLGMYGSQYTVACNADEGFTLLKAIGATELVGYILLWVAPQFGATFLTVFMGFGLHFHMRQLKETPSALGLQLTLFMASLLVLYLEVYREETAGVTTPAKRARAKVD